MAKQGGRKQNEARKSGQQPTNYSPVHPQICWTRWDLSRSCGNAFQAAQSNFSAVLAIWEVPFDWRLANVIMLIQEGWEGGALELQTCQSGLRAREGLAADQVKPSHDMHGRSGCSDPVSMEIRKAGPA